MEAQHRFRRVTDSRAYIPEIDGLRFIAIFSVVLFHLCAQLHRYYKVAIPSILNELATHGDRGVRIFFVISGFILALPFARYHLKNGRPVSLRHYFFRRITRLEPPLLLVTLGLASLIYLTLHVPLKQVIVHLLATVGYCHGQIFGKMSSIIPVSWSLEVEVQFYVLVPLLTFVFSLSGALRRRTLLSVSILLIGIGQTLIPSVPAGRFQLSLCYYLQFFLGGFLLADFFLFRKASRPSWGWDLFSVLGWPLVFLAPDSWLQVLLPFLLPLLFWAALEGRVFTRLLRLNAVTATGGMCYTIYLVHFALIAMATKAVGHESSIAMVLASLCSISLVSCAFFLLVEKPCMNPNWPLVLRAGVLRYVRGRLSDLAFYRSLFVDMRVRRH